MVRKFVLKALLALVFTVPVTKGIAAGPEQVCAQDIAVVTAPCNDFVSDPARFRQCLQTKLTKPCYEHVITKKRSEEPDQSCNRELNDVSTRCDSAKITRECLQRKLSPTCNRAVSAGRVGQTDPVCKEEIQRITQTCSQEIVAQHNQCLKTNLSSNCWEQVKTYQVAGKSCEEIIQRVKQTCTAQNKEFTACSEQYRTEITALCNK